MSFHMNKSKLIHIATGFTIICSQQYLSNKRKLQFDLQRQVYSSIKIAFIIQKKRMLSYSSASIKSQHNFFKLGQRFIILPPQAQ